MDLKPVLRKIITVGRAGFTILFALVVLAVMVWAYIEGFTLATSRFNIISFGFYGLILGIHVLLQSIFAFVEHRKMGSRREPCSYTKTIGLTISAYQEDPAYLRECLNSVRALQYPPELLRVIMVVDGNTDDDLYMMEMFREVFVDQDFGYYKWEHNYHTWDPRPQGEQAVGSPAGDAGLRAGEEDPQRREVEELIRSKRCVCIMQKWGGKREVMYTAFKALGSSVDYVQVRRGNEPN